MASGCDYHDLPERIDKLEDKTGELQGGLDTLAAIVRQLVDAQPTSVRSGLLANTIAAIAGAEK